MKIYLKTIVLFISLLLINDLARSQARLTINNNSQREITVKVMRGAGKGTLHEKVVIPAYSSETVYFSETGNYFTKSKAILNGKEPLYKKGNSFRVYNGTDGYSILTLTYSIKESTIPVSTGQTISKSEFDQN